jgi:hypothetical protein
VVAGKAFLIERVYKNIVLLITEETMDSQYSSHFITNYTPVECLGSGRFGIVYRCKHKLDGLEYAVKRILLPISSENRSGI